MPSTRETEHSAIFVLRTGGVFLLPVDRVVSTLDLAVWREPGGLERHVFRRLHQAGTWEDDVLFYEEADPAAADP